MKSFLVFVLFLNSFKAEEIWLVKFTPGQNYVSYIEKTFPFIDLLDHDYTESSYVFLVPKVYLKTFAQFIDQHHGSHRIISKQIPNDWIKPRARPKREINLANDPLDKSYYQRYLSYDEQQQWFSLLANSSSTKPYVHLHDIGQTHENRSLTVVQIKSRQPAPSKNRRKLSVFIDGGMHAREWLSIGVANFLIVQLLTLKNSDPKIRQLLRHFNVYILPMMNPDGYEYSRKTNRLWRKNRTPSSPKYFWSYDLDCYGADLNRNFPHQWSLVNGASGDPCSEAYRGDSPLSEAEVRSVANFLKKFQTSRHRFHAYFNLHAYGRLWLLPWTFTEYEKVSNYDDLLKRSNDVVSKVMNKTYLVGQASALLYPCTGTSIDFASTLMPHAITFELSPAHSNLPLCLQQNVTTGPNCTVGFLTGPEMIETDGTEIFRAIVEYLTSIVRDNFL